MKRIAATAALVAALTAPVAAQELPGAPAEGQALVDRVVAVVGDSVVLQSMLDEQLLRLQMQGQPLPSDPEALERLRRQLLDPMISELLLIQAAQRDSIVVLDADVQSRVEAEIRRRERSFGSRAALEQALAREGLTLSQYRDVLGADIRRTGLVQQYIGFVERDRRPPPVTEREMRAYLEAQREELGERPATISFRQVVVAPTPSDSAKAAALERAREVLRRARAGEDFAELARRFSDEPGARERAGDLGWFRPGMMVPEFEQVAFSLRPGQVSHVVETQFGFHVIKVEKVKGPERQARHVLIRPELGEGAEARAEATAREVAAKLRAGAALDSLVRKYGDPAEQDRIGPAVRDSLPSPYASQLENAREGEVVGPFPVPAPTGQKWAVAKVTDVTQAGAYSLEQDDVRDQVRRQLQREKLLEELVAELRRRTYIDIRL